MAGLWLSCLLFTFSLCYMRVPLHMSSLYKRSNGSSSVLSACTSVSVQKVRVFVYRCGNTCVMLSSVRRFPAIPHIFQAYQRDNCLCAVDMPSSGSLRASASTDDDHSDDDDDGRELRYKKCKQPTDDRILWYRSPCCFVTYCKAETVRRRTA